MRFTCNLCKTLAATGVFALLAPLTTVADMHGDKAEGDEASMAKHDGQQHDKQGYDEKQGKRPANLENAVSARTLLGGNVENVANPIGDVRDLILTEDRSAVEYVLYEVPYPYANLGAQNGFVAFDNVAIQDGATFDTNLRIDEGAEGRKPQELTLTRGEADHRTVSRILEDEVVFGDGQEVRDIEDILIDRNTGEVLGYVVNRNPDAWFNDEPAIITPGNVTVEPDGNVTTEAEFAALESLKK